MSASTIASLIALLPNLLIALHALVGWLKMRDNTRLLMLLVFGSSVVSSLLSLVVNLAYNNGGQQLSTVSKLSTVLTLTAVYAFFLFMAEFAPVRRWAHYLALGALLLIVAWIVVTPLTFNKTSTGTSIVPESPVLLSAEAAYYLILVIIIAFRFWQHSFALVGISRKRVQAIALGTTLAVASIIPALAVLNASADVRDAVGWVTRVMGLVAGAIYYLGFATPRWLRDIWTSTERSRIGNLSLATAGGRPPAALMQDVLTTAIEVSGAQAGALTLADDPGQELKLQVNNGLPDELIAPLLAGGDRFSKRLGAARGQPLIMRTRPARNGVPSAKLSAIMDTPMFLGDTFVGVIRLVADRSLVFEDDDASIMQVLGAQAAVSLDTAIRLEESREEAQRAGRLYTEVGVNLRQRVSELRAVLGSMADGLYVVDTSGRIIMINRVAAEMAGSSEADLLGKPAADVLNFALDHNTLVEPALQRGETTAHQETTLRNSTSEIPINIVASPLFDDEQQPRGVVVNFRDITAEKETQRIKDEFIATVSHELRTPLTAILGERKTHSDE